MLYCTTDGTTPTTSSPTCAQPTTIYKTEFLQAIAVAPGKSASPAASAAYTIDLNAAATPTFSPAGGSYTSTETVTLADATAGANIFYTLDGSVPTTGSTLYTGPIAVASTETISAVATASGYNNSGVASATYVVNPAVAAPVFSVPAGSYSTAQTVGISDASPGATIYYTLDGTTPTSSSAVYAGPISISQTATLNAIAAAPGLAASPVVSASYVISLAAAPAPGFTPAAGTYTSVQSVAITDALAGATIHYTTDGSTPTASSPVSSGLISVGTSETLEAIAVAPGYTASPVATAAYVINLSAAAPVISPGAGTYTTVQTVTLTDATPGATIYYTADGSTPTTSSPVYAGPLTVSSTETLKAIAAAPGYNASPVASALFTINLGGTATPVFSLAAGTFTSPQTVSIADATANATIYYTVDGSTPTTASSVYSTPLTVSSTETLQAIATAPGLSPSTVASAVYTISLGNASLIGTVLSGATPVSGATVQLYAASTAGYGSPGTALLGAAVTTSSSGAFRFSYNCAAAPGDLVYLVATGGDAGSGVNTALELMAALGSCGSLTGTPTVVVNEAPTVASAYALSAFMTAAPGVGASSGNYQGLANAFATVANLVDPSTGAVRSITPAYATNTVAYLNSSTVPQARIDTLADILNACVDSNGAGGGCSNLFSAATPAGGAAPGNTLQAILNVAQNPGASASTLFGLASPTGPFQPELPAAPTDWTLALTFTGGGLGISPTAGAMVTNGGSTFTIGIINTGLAIDAAGKVWVTAYEDNSPSFPAFSNSEGTFVAEFNPVGAPLTPSTTLDSSANATIGGYAPEGTATVALTALAFDQSGNGWLGDTQTGNVLKISPSLSVLLQPTPALNQGVGTITIDSSGDAWTGGIALSAFHPDGTPFSNLTSVSGIGPANAYGYGKLGGLTFDSHGGLWGADSLSPESSSADLYQIDPATGIITYDAYPMGGSYATLVADEAGNLYGCGDAGGQTLDVFSAGALANSYSIATGRGCGSQLLLDGSGHLFAILNSAGFPSGMVIDEFTTAGVAISTPGGYTGTSASEPPTLNPDPNVYAPVPGLGAAIDGSGNLWVLNNDTNGASAAGNVLVEFVGIAAPVVTPTSLALTNGSLGARP